MKKFFCLFILLFILVGLSFVSCSEKKAHYSGDSAPLEIVGTEKIFSDNIEKFIFVADTLKKENAKYCRISISNDKYDIVTNAKEIIDNKEFKETALYIINSLEIDFIHKDEDQKLILFEKEVPGGFVQIIYSYDNKCDQATKIIDNWFYIEAYGV